LSAPTVTANNASSPIPNFNVQVAIPAAGRVTYGELYYTLSATPTANDWQLLSTAGRVNGEPQTPGTNYVFTNQVLPTGASTSATYYFCYILGNDLARSSQSPISAAFTWTPTGSTGPAGENGLTALTAYLVQAQNLSTPSFTTPTSGATAPAGWSLTTPSVAVGQVLWYIQGRYNDNAVTVDGVGANTTAWTGPIAASVFQDIRSDNWNGSNPPVAGTPATYGTAGYYIQRNTGNMFLNSVYARGIAQFDGANSVAGGYNAAILANASLGQNIGVQAFTNNTFITSGAVRAFNQAAGSGNAIYASHVGTGQAILAQSASGIGVKGSGSTGVEGTGTNGVTGFGSSSGYGVQATDLGGATAALGVSGTMTISNSTLVTNLNADLLDGNHASAFATSASGTAAYAADRLNGSTANTLRFVSGTTSGSATATFSGTTKPGSNSTNSWMVITIDGTTLYIPVWT
jgi:hypothetical protein